MYALSLQRCVADTAAIACPMPDADVVVTFTAIYPVCSRAFTKYPRSAANIVECVTEIYGIQGTEVKRARKRGGGGGLTFRKLSIYLHRVNVLNVKIVFGSDERPFV